MSGGGGGGRGGMGEVKNKGQYILENKNRDGWKCDNVGRGKRKITFRANVGLPSSMFHHQRSQK